MMARRMFDNELRALAEGGFLADLLRAGSLLAFFLHALSWHATPLTLFCWQFAEHGAFFECRYFGDGCLDDFR